MHRVVDDLALALELADIADRITMRRYRARDLVIDTKLDLTPVTESDRAVELALRERVAAVSSGDAVIGEEFGSNDQHTSRCWIIDPIDGTRNFIRHVPIWAVLIGLEEAGEVTAGVVFNPASGDLFWARRGDGAWADSARLRVSDCAALKDATLLHADLHLLREGGHWNAFVRMVDGCGRTRGFGDYYGYGLVASGRAELYMETDLKPWDVAPVKILVEEAGGRLTDFAGRPTIYDGSVLATNGRLHKAALELLAS